MSTQLYNLQDLHLLHNSHKTLRLLRMRQMPLILSFLYHSFKETGQYSQPIDLLETTLTRYLERLVLGDQAADPEAGGLTLDTLRENGYL